MSLSLRTTLGRLLPPILTDGLRILQRRLSNEPPEWEYLPQGWRTSDPRMQGWNVESVMETQEAKWPAFLRSIQGNGPLGVAHEASRSSNTDYAVHNALMAYAYVLALAAHRKDRISMLDWGGGLGHYCLISKALLPEVQVEYHCRDLPLLCRRGRELLPDASFYDTEDASFGRTYDLVLASASLNYTEEWRGLMRRLASVASSFLYITRLPIVHHAPSFVVVQRPYRYGYLTEYPGWFLNRVEVLECAAASRMELLREFLIDERPFVHGAPEQGEYRGFLFRPIQERVTT